MSESVFNQANANGLEEESSQEEWEATVGGDFDASFGGEGDPEQAEADEAANNGEEEAEEENPEAFAPEPLSRDEGDIRLAAWGTDLFSESPSTQPISVTEMFAEGPEPEPERKIPAILAGWDIARGPMRLPNPLATPS